MVKKVLVQERALLVVQVEVQLVVQEKVWLVVLRKENRKRQTTIPT